MPDHSTPLFLENSEIQPNRNDEDSADQSELISSRKIYNYLHSRDIIMVFYELMHELRGKGENDLVDELERLKAWVDALKHRTSHDCTESRANNYASKVEYLCSLFLSHASPSADSFKISINKLKSVINTISNETEKAY